MEETPEPANVPLPQSLTPSPPQGRTTPIIPAPWNRSPTLEEIPLPPILPVTQLPERIPLPPVKQTAPLLLDLIPLPWDMPPFPRITPEPSPPVASSSQLPLIVSMTPSRTTPLLPKHPLTEEEPLVNKPTPPEWKRVQALPVTGKQKEFAPEVEPLPPTPPPHRPPQPAPIRTTPLFKKHEEFNREGGPLWKKSQPSPSTGKRQESPRHVAMPLKRERSDPEEQQSMSPEEQPTPPDSPKTTSAQLPS